MEVKSQKEETNNWVKVWLILSYLIVLFYMYAYYEGSGKTARETPIEAHLQHAMTTIIVGYASLLWGLQCVSLSCRFLFLSFAMFRLFALLHRIFAYVFDMVLVTNTPTYSALAFIALIFGVYDYHHRRDSKGSRTSEC
jgi:hypothetical protein